MMKYDFANITVRPFLKLSDVNNPYIFGETKHVIDMCYYREPEVIDLIYSKGSTFDWFPTEEQPMDVNAILQAVAKLFEYDRDNSPIIVHCLGGNNRSRTVVEAYHLAKVGRHLEDEYKGYPNHLLYNCGEGFLPPIKEMGKMLFRLTPRPYTVETFGECEGMTFSALAALSEEEWRVFNAFDKEFPDKTTSELIKLTFEKTGRYEFDD